MDMSRLDNPQVILKITCRNNRIWFGGNTWWLESIPAIKIFSLDKLVLITLQPPNLHANMAVTVRKATLKDLETVLEIRLESFFGSDEWRYRYPGYEEFKEDHDLAANGRILEYLLDETDKKGVIMLAEVDVRGGDKVGKYAISWSVWKTNAPDSSSSDVVKIESCEF